MQDPLWASVASEPWSQSLQPVFQDRPEEREEGARRGNVLRRLGGAVESASQFPFQWFWCLKSFDYAKLGPWDLSFQKRMICLELGNLELKSGQNVVHGSGQRDDPGRITALQVCLA